MQTSTRNISIYNIYSTKQNDKQGSFLWGMKNYSWMSSGISLPKKLLMHLNREVYKALMSKIILRCYDNSIDTAVCFNYRVLPKKSLCLLAVTCRHTGYDWTAAFSEVVCVLDLSSGELKFASEMINTAVSTLIKSICTVPHLSFFI